MNGNHRLLDDYGDPGHGPGCEGCFPRKGKAMNDQGSVAGMAWQLIAASAYRAYAASTGNKNFRGEPMPEFAALPQPIKTAWEAAVRQAGVCLNVQTISGEPPDEQVWAGWVPPHLLPS